MLDIAAGAHAGLGGGACADLLGGMPEEVPARYRLASPFERVPIGIPITCVHGTDDRHVPPEQSGRFVEAAVRAGDRADLVEIDGDHFAPIDPQSPAWTAARRAISDASG